MMNEFLDLEMLFDRGIVLGHYPLHKPSQLLELRANWGSMKALFRK